MGALITHLQVDSTRRWKAEGAEKADRAEKAEEEEKVPDDSRATQPIL
jgi:hypothetical protein